MQSESRQAHWQNVYTKKGENEVIRSPRRREQAARAGWPFGH
jgi:hypothetical protein